MEDAITADVFFVVVVYCFCFVFSPPLHLVKVGLSKMRSHTATCSKYQEYIEEGVRTTAQSQPAIVR